MNSPEEPSPNSTNGVNEPEFEQELQTTEESLAQIKARYEQVKRDRLRQQELGHRREEIHQQSRQNLLPELKQELKQIKAELEALELNLESNLLNWRSLREPFWQAIRFGGLGIVIGWILKSCTG